MKDNGIIKTIRNLMRVRQLLKKDFKIKIQTSYPLDKAQQAVETYLNNMTGGKVLLVPVGFADSPQFGDKPLSDFSPV
jgi:hypothetical protein